MEVKKDGERFDVHSLKKVSIRGRTSTRTYCTVPALSFRYTRDQAAIPSRWILCSRKSPSSQKRAHSGTSRPRTSFSTLCRPRRWLACVLGAMSTCHYHRCQPSPFLLLDRILAGLPRVRCGGRSGTRARWGRLRAPASTPRLNPTRYSTAKTARLFLRSRGAPTRQSRPPAAPTHPHAHHPTLSSEPRRPPLTTRNFLDML
ncbi:hypothetical protein BC628DRAFT_60873 [Trametes gibbosa]|nr:hypothetical protein BC628DRAFT_60873 [Trametes gibbosa]